MCHEQGVALINAPTRGHETVGRCEINFRLVIWNEVRPKEYSLPLHVRTDRFPDRLPVSLAPIRPAGSDQPIILTSGQNLLECADKLVEPLVRRDSAKKRSILSPSRMPSRCFPSSGVRRVFGNSIVDPERDDGDPCPLGIAQEEPAIGCDLPSLAAALHANTGLGEFYFIG